MKTTLTTIRRPMPMLACALLAAAGLARADGMPSEAPKPASAMSRAEVLADLTLWQRAGLDAMSAGEAGADAFGARFQAAHAAYEAERNGPNFAALVERIARERGERTDVAATR